MEIIKKRVENEIKRLSSDFQHVSTVILDNNIDNDEPFVISSTFKLMGPVESQYGGHEYQLEFKYPKDYPFSPPSVTFLTPIIHPNVVNNYLFIQELEIDDWHVFYTASFLLNIIQTVMMTPRKTEYMDMEAWKIYKTSGLNDDRPYNEIEDVFL